MPRRARMYLPGLSYHVVQPGRYCYHRQASTTPCSAGVEGLAGLDHSDALVILMVNEYVVTKLLGALVVIGFIAGLVYFRYYDAFVKSLRAKHHSIWAKLGSPAFLEY